MNGKKAAVELGIGVAGALVKNAPEIIERMTKRKEEKNFFEENRSWIFLIILSIFVTNLDYINMFEDIILSSIINIIYGIIVFVLLFLFYYEEKSVFKINSNFIKFLIVSIFIMGIINSFYHICYAIINFLSFIL